MEEESPPLEIGCEEATARRVGAYISLSTASRTWGLFVRVGLLEAVTRHVCGLSFQLSNSADNPETGSHEAYFMNM